MTHRSIRWRTWLAALALPLALGACGDDDDPSDPDERDVNGTWAFTEDGITSYVRISQNTIEIFNNTGTCVVETELGIESVDGDVFVVDTGGATVEWTIEEVGNNIVIEDDEGISTTLTPSSVNISTLAACEPFDPEVDDFPHATCSSLTQLGVPGSVDGAIVPGDARWPADSTWYDLYRLQIAALSDVRVDMVADNQDDLDTYLIITDETGGRPRVAEDDDSGDGSDARAQMTLDPGCYIVVAGSWQGAEPGETGGGYTLSATTELISDFPHPTCTAIPEVTVGGAAVSGTLVEGDQRFSDSDPSWIDLWSLQLDTEQTVSILMEEDGSGIDTYLRLYNSLGTIEIDNDDDIDGSNFNSLIENITLEAGCYIIVANSYEGDDEGEVGGAYTLQVD